MDISEYKRHFEIEDKHFWFIGRRIILSKHLRRLANSGENKILDIGCGTGGNLSFLDNYGTVFGLDNSLIAIQFAKKKGYKRLIVGRVESLPVKRVFDIVTALDVLEHIKMDKLALREMREILRINGFLILSVPAFKFLWSSHDRILHHKRRYEYTELKHKVRKVGFKLLKLSFFSFFIFPLVLILRVMRNFLCFKNREKSDAVSIPSPLNKILIQVYYLESWVLERFAFPCGVSLLCIARK